MGGGEYSHPGLERGEDAPHLVAAAREELGSPVAGGVVCRKLSDKRFKAVGGVSSLPFGSPAENLVDRGEVLRCYGALLMEGDGEDERREERSRGLRPVRGASASLVGDDDGGYGVRSLLGFLEHPPFGESYD